MEQEEKGRLRKALVVEVLGGERKGGGQGAENWYFFSKP
jgi:hypothetical protein